MGTAQRECIDSGQWVVNNWQHYYYNNTKQNGKSLQKCGVLQYKSVKFVWVRLPLSVVNSLYDWNQMFVVSVVLIWFILFGVTIVLHPYKTMHIEQM